EFHETEHFGKLAENQPCCAPPVLAGGGPGTPQPQANQLQRIRAQCEECPPRNEGRQDQSGGRNAETPKPRAAGFRNGMPLGRSSVKSHTLRETVTTPQLSLPPLGKPVNCGVMQRHRGFQVVYTPS